MALHISETHIDGVQLVHGARFHDARGFFQELYNEVAFPPRVRVDRFKQVVPIFCLSGTA